MNDYEKIVLKSLKKAGSMTNKDLRLAVQEEMPSKGVSKHGDGYVPELDRALQKLRKSGEIKYLDRAWTLSGAKTCPRCKGTGRIH